MLEVFLVRDTYHYGGSGPNGCLRSADDINSLLDTYTELQDRYVIRTSTKKIKVTVNGIDIYINKVQLQW